MTIKRYSPEWYFIKRMKRGKGIDMKLTESDGLEKIIGETIWDLTKENISLKKRVKELESKLRGHIK